MNEKIFIINYFDKKEMKWYENEECDQNQDKSPLEYRQEYQYKHTKWYHEKGKPPVEAPINENFTDEFVQLPPLLEFQEYEDYVPIEEDKNLEIIETLSLEDCFICGDKYYSDFVEGISLEQLNEYPLILLEKGSNTRRFIDKVFSDNNILVEPEIELGSVDLLVKFAKIGLGISFVTKNFIHNELENKEVYEIKLKEEIPKRKVGVVTLKGVPLASAGKKFFDFLMRGN